MTSILYVITNFSMGGAERQLQQLAKKMIDYDCLVSIVVLNDRVDLDVDKKIKVHSLNIDKTWLGFIFGLLSLVKIIRRVKPDVVHSHMFHANILSRIACVFYRRAFVVSTAHSNNEGGFVRMLAYRLTNRLADFFTNVSGHAALSFVEKGAVKATEDIIAIHNGVDVDLYKFDLELRSSARKSIAVSDHEKLFLSVGRLEVEKNHKQLIDAFSNVLKLNDNIKLLIVGDGSLKSELIQQVERLKLCDKVTFYGISNKIEELFCASDVVVHPSLWEGFGLVVAEAMSCQCYVIASDCGGVRHVMGETGLLVPKDSQIELQDAIIKVLDKSNEDMVKNGIAARNRILSELSLDSISQRWLDIYNMQGEFNR